MKVAIYARVSTEEQSLDQQIEPMIEYCKKMEWDYTIFQDKISGKTESRPSWNECISRLRKLDFNILMVWKLDRLGRSLSHLIQILKELDHKKINFIVLSQNIDTSTAQGKFFFHVIGAIAEFEREMISIRVKERMNLLKKRGVHLGRPKS